MASTTTRSTATTSDEQQPPPPPQPLHAKRLEGIQFSAAANSRLLELLLVDQFGVDDDGCLPRGDDGERKTPDTGAVSFRPDLAIPTLSKEEAAAIVSDFRKQHQRQQKQRYAGATSTNGETEVVVVPIRVVRGLAALVGRDAVERALQPSSGADRTITSSSGCGDVVDGGCDGGGGGDDARLRLAYTPPPPSCDVDGCDDDTKSPTERRRFQKRMERLRLRYEESKYARLTKNLGTVIKDDDVTTKSMTYAASIGLNMIVAPLSFGCLMYFFAGGLFDFLWPMQRPQHPSAAAGADIRKVIVGVVSGVLMLFIEMLLFVIRTHELDRAVRRKSRKHQQRGGAPFGYYTSKTTKTFKGE